MGNPTTPATAPTEFRLIGAGPKLIAQVDEACVAVGSISPKVADGSTPKLGFGNDITFGGGGKVPSGTALPCVEADLRKTIMVLPSTYGKSSGALATNAFTEFLKKRGSLAFYTDTLLDAAVERDSNFIAFSDYTLNEPGNAPHYAGGRMRLHQALKIVNWDINKVTLLSGLGILAFNQGIGIPGMATEDHANGLTIVIDTVAHTLIFVTNYSYSSATGKYDIELLFEMYDAFGLDDGDIATYGYKAKLINQLDVNKGFTAWWQLQHQFSYAPLITKVVVKRSFTGIAAV